MIQHSQGVSPSFQAQYRERLTAISQQAEGLKELEQPEVVSGFLESSLTSTVERYAPGSELQAYTKLVQGTARELTEQPELRQKLWETAFRVASQGIPGGAGIALAKTVESTISSRPAEEQGLASQMALDQMRVGYGQQSKGEALHATIALDALGQAPSLAAADLIARNAVSTVARMEDWNIV